MTVAWGENRAQLNHLFIQRRSLTIYSGIHFKYYTKFILLNARHFFNYTS